MKRFHVHVAVDNLRDNIKFYSQVFGAPPSVEKTDYAKWMLDDPRVNVAISTRGRKAGLDHFGFQVENDGELKEMRTNLIAAQAPLLEQQEASCCYAKSDKYWTVDPQGIAWETFHTLGDIPVFGADSGIENIPVKSAACCAPALG